MSATRILGCFGPEVMRRSTHNPYEVKDSCVVGFQWAIKAAACAEENIRSLRFNGKSFRYSILI